MYEITIGRFVARSLGKKINDIDFFSSKSIMILNLFRDNNLVKILNQL